MTQSRQRPEEVAGSTIGRFVGALMVAEQTVAAGFGIDPSWIIMGPALLFFFGPSTALALIRAWKANDGGNSESA